MPSKPKSPQDGPVQVEPSVDPRTGITLLRKLIEKAEALVESPDLQSTDGTAWDTLARDYLISVFGSRSPNVATVIHAHGDGSLYANMPRHEYRQYMRSEYQNKIKLLGACIEQLQTDIELESQSTPVSTSLRNDDRVIPTRKVFVVHGHNAGVKESVARFLEKLDLEAVILHEKPNAGRTVIEKFSDYVAKGARPCLLHADGEAQEIEVLPPLLPREISQEQFVVPS